MMMRSPVFSPKFSRRSAKNLVETAARVVEQLNAGSDFSDDGDDVAGEDSKEEEMSSNVIEEEFEFAFAPRETAFSPISADEIFCNGQILPVFPVHKQNLLTAEAIFPEWRSNFFAVSKYGGKKAPASASASAPARRPLRKLLGEIRESPSSDSSSEADDIDGGVQGAGMYCVWLPKPAARGRCKLMSCTTGGSSKRWKFRDLLRRSNSDGKDAFVFLTSSVKKLMDKKLKKAAANETPNNPAGK